MKVLNYIRVVLIEPTHPGNIGATARAMANMGVNQLMLIKPKIFPSPIANARAAGADHILKKAQVFDNLDQAIADCTLVLGTTSRHRSLEWQSLEPGVAMEKAATHANHSQVGILFGRESSGLTNDELERCHHLVRIPVADEFASLNLSAAVMVMLYELRRSLLEKEAVSPPHANESAANEPMATAADMQNFYTHLQQVLELIEFSDGRSTKLHRKLTRLFNRARPYDQEIKMLRGILSAIESKIIRPEQLSPDRSSTNSSLARSRTNPSLARSRTNSPLARSRTNSPLARSRTNSSLARSRTNSPLIRGARGVMPTRQK